MKQYLVRPGQKVDLDDLDPGDTSEVPGGQPEAKQKILEIRGRLADLQEMLFAEHRRAVLVILQGTDTSGKDGTIRHVMAGFNPQGTRVVSFGPPSDEELHHDFLWRVHRQVPGKGEIGVFNRSHYEDVLVSRVRELVPKEVWRERYDQINGFEQMLAENGTWILKFFLHISKDEQRERLQRRLNDPKKCWKFKPSDLEERQYWDAYQRAYEDALAKTSTEWAPWHVVPANHKWYRNYVVGSILVESLKKLHLKYPRCDVPDVVVE